MEQHLNNLINMINLTFPVCEEEGGLTYYELRQFVTLIFKQSSGDTKKILGDILKILTIMEIKKIPVPTIQKIKSNSPKIFN